jgi:hypothetical protein
MNGNKKYWIFWTKWTFIYLKDGKWKFEFRNMQEYWILFFAKFILSNNVMKLNNDWSNL